MLSGTVAESVPVGYGGPFPHCSLRCGSGASSVATAGEADPGAEQLLFFPACAFAGEAFLLDSKAVEAVKQCCLLRGYNGPGCVSQQQ